MCVQRKLLLQSRVLITAQCYLCSELPLALHVLLTYCVLCLLTEFAFTVQLSLHAAEQLTLSTAHLHCGEVIDGTQHEAHGALSHVRPFGW